MKYGDIVVYKNQIGTVVKSENDFKFHPCNYESCYFSELDTVTDSDVREATPDEKLELIEKEFTWGNVIKVHCIGEYQIVEYIVHNGMLKDLSVLQEAPFTDQGSVVEIFKDITVWMGIKRVIDSINANAAA